MSIHPHRCDECEVVIELWLKPSELEDIQLCEKCSRPMTRCISDKTNFKLVGRGWANTGYSKAHPPFANQHLREKK